MAAHRGGIKKILIPMENEKDLKDIPKTIARDLDIVTVEHMDEVLTHALIVGADERLFKEVDVPLAMVEEPKAGNKTAPLN